MYDAMSEFNERTIGETQRAQADMRLCDALFKVALADKAKWEEIARLTFPELLDVADLNEEHVAPKVDGQPLCDYAATLMTELASAHVSYITPMGERWFQFAPWESEAAAAGDWQDTSSWFARTTQVCQEVLEASNFYTEQIATYIDRGVTGTGAMILEQTADFDIVWTHVPAGTYGIAENALHQVDTFCRKFNATPAQLVQLFGEEGLSAETRRLYESEDDRYTKKVLVYQLIEPRRGVKVSRDSWERDAGKMPYRNVYIEAGSAHILLESGYTEFPVYVTRFLRYGNYPYGRSALATVVQTMKDLTKLQSIELTAAERTAVPSLLVTPELAGHVDLRAGGQTIVSAVEGGDGMPREFAPAGNLSNMLVTKQDMKETLDAAAFKNVLQPVSRMDRQMTATEVSARQAEAIMSFTQSFTQDQADKQAILPRLFCCVLRMGKLPQDGMPKELISEGEVDGMGTYVMGEAHAPRVTFVGRMAQFLQRAQRSALSATVGELVEMAKATGSGDWLLPLDVAKIARWQLTNSAIPQQCLRKQRDVERKQREAEEAQRAAMQAQLMEQASAANLNQARASNA